jgi:uncharacterized protein YhaN
MRIQRLTLDLFGQFTDKSYDFGTGPQDTDFHVIYGPNEAGKTTTMEGFLRLLYGFPNRDPYGFLHQRKHLRVSGVIENDGETRLLTRLPVRTGDLVDAHGTVVPETAISGLLGGLGLEDYRNLLCLDDATIEKGGAEIANSKGETGKLLFAAAAGVSDLSDILDHVAEQAGEIYRKGGTKTEIAALKKELVDVDAAIRAGDLSIGAYRKLRQAHEAAVVAETEVRADRDALTEAQAQTAARLRALPMVVEIDGLDNAVAPYADYPALLDFDPETLVLMANRKALGDADRARLGGEITGLKAALAALSVPDQAAALTDALAELDALRSRYVTAEQDVPRRRQGVQEIEADMVRVAAQLGAKDPADGVTSAAAIAGLETAREAWRQTQDAQRSADAEAVRARAALAALTGTEQAEAAPVAVGIAAVLDRFGADRLAVQYATAQADIATAQDHACAALAALTWGGQVFAAIPECAVTAVVAQALATQDATWAQDIAQAGKLAREIQDAVAVRRAQMAQMKSAPGVVDDTDAAAGIAARDALWQAHRGDLSTSSADAFETAMRAVDQSSAARMAQAAGIAEIRQNAQGLVADEARLAQVNARISEAEQARAEIAEQIDGAARDAGIAQPIPVRDFAEWCAAREAALVGVARAVEKAQNHAGVIEKAAALRAALEPFVDLDTPEFADLVDAARHLADVERKAQAAVAARAAALDAQRRETAHRIAASEGAQTQAAEAEAAWAAAVEAAFGGRIAVAALAPSLEPVRQLTALDSKRREDAHRIAAMEADQAAFVGRVAELATQRGIETAAPLAQFAALAAMETAGQAAVARQAELQAELASKHTALAEVGRQLDTVTAEAAAIARVFPETVPTGTLDALRQAVSRAQDVIAARARKTQAEQRICLDLSVVDMVAARDALDGVTQPGLEAEATRIAADLEAVDTRLNDAITARVETKSALDAVTGDDDIARLVERKTTLELQIEDAAGRYLELRIGHVLAEEAIRRYRDTHRGGMMDATERAFVGLTKGAYQKLLTQRGSGGAEVLLAVDADGATKGAEDMSKGTRFQLYLALRAAAHEQMVEQGVVLPFFCDDIFETFDEDRTRAACGVMADIGTRGQAIYLTHHAHVVDIARETCGDRVRVHRI